MMPIRSHAFVAAVLAAASLLLVGCGTPNDDSAGSKAGKVALLLPENKTARYESQDRPIFEARLRSRCADCELLYSNANQDADKQSSQALSLIHI